MTEPGIDAVRAARAELDEVIARIRDVEGFERFLAPPSFDEIAEEARAAPLIYLAAGDGTGLALVVRGSDVTPLWLGDLTADAVRERTREHLAVYTAYRAAPPGDRVAATRWDHWLESLLDWLGTVAMGPVLELLRDGERAAVLIAGGLLGLLPLHAARTPDPTAPTGHSFALDRVSLSYAPNARVLTASRELARTIQRRRLLSVVEPWPVEGDRLPCAAVEAGALAARWTDEVLEPLAGENATPRTFVRRAAQADVLHLACHGWADLEEPLRSGVLLAGRPMALKTLMEERLRVRLAILSACETALPGTDLPDEVVGLPTGLLQAGVAGVVASQWAVPDRATAMLMARFGEYWADDDAAPARALVRAQQWLRDTTNQEKSEHWDRAAREVPELGPVAAAFRLALRAGEPDARDHHAPSAWAAFTHVGV